MKHPSSLNRRQFLEITATAVAAAPFLTHAAESSSSGVGKIRLGSVSWNFHSLGPSADPEEAIEIVGGLGFDGIELIATSSGDFKTFWTDARVDRLKQNSTGTNCAFPNLPCSNRSSRTSRVRAARSGSGRWIL